MRGFLYGQTEYNLYRSTNRLDEYIALAKESHFEFLSITDRNMYGHYKFYKGCLEAGIKPVIGLEYAYNCPDNRQGKLLLYAKNNAGYKALLKISSMVMLENINTLEAISPLCEDIKVIFVYNNSYFDRLYSAYDYDELKKYVQESFLLFSDAFMGISYTNALDKLEANKSIASFVAQMDIQSIPVHECRYLKNSDVMVYEALSSIGYNSPMRTEEVKVSDYEDYSFDTSPVENEAVDKFVNSIFLNLFNDKIALPKFPDTKGIPSKDYLSALCHKGLAKRIGDNNVYLSRLDYELGVIHKMGFDDYFLIVWDFIKYAKQNKVLVGPGRGSAAGSLVAFCLGITDVDPIKYDLLFERFLNPERVSMPDIDTDIPDNKRNFVIEHVKNLYGEDHVCSIIAYGTFKFKSAIRDFARLFKMSEEKVKVIIDLVDKNGFEKMLEEYKDNDEVYHLLYVASRLEGLPRNTTTHAAGIILSEEPLEDIIPIQSGINGVYQSQLEAPDLEKIGLLKMDFLGISNLSMIKDMMDLIPGFDAAKLRAIPLDDARTYEMLRRGDTLGIFQLESEGIRKVIMDLGPTEFEDLVAVLALYRPGPMDFIPDYIARKHGARFSYIHPDLEPILKSTYGIIVYQEQIMKIALKFAGYSLGEADILRRAVSKKKAEVLEEKKKDFVSRSVKNGYSLEVANNIYDMILKFANYGFNRSHTVAYGIFAYQMAYLKANYFPVFMAVMLNNVATNSDTLFKYIKYATARGLVIKKPDINISNVKFVITKDGIYMPFNTISSVGMVATEEIVKERDANGLFKNYYDFKTRCSFLSSAMIEALVYAGALDGFGKSKKNLIESKSALSDLMVKMMDDYIEKNDEYSFDVLKEKEKKYLGFNLEYNPYKDLDLILKKQNAIRITSMRYGLECKIIAGVVRTKVIKTKKNEEMLVGQIGDDRVEVDFVIFPSDYRGLNLSLENGKMYQFIATLTKDKKNNNSIVIRHILELK